MKYFLLFSFILLFANPSINIAQTVIVDGYTDKFSYAPGDTLKAYINASVFDSLSDFGLFDLTGVKVDKVVSPAGPQVVNIQAPYKNGFGYQITFTYIIPDYLRSGIYLWKNKVPFIVKSTGKKHDIVVLYESNTMAAYNNRGGKSFYFLNSTISKSHVLSFLRPSSPQILSSFSRKFMEWLKAYNLCDVGYICDVDMDDYSEIEQAKLLIITGHSEYWTRKARKNFDRFNDTGGNVLVLAGNTMAWQVRYNSDKTQIICYKDSVDDPHPDPLLQTIHWSDSSLAYPTLSSIGVDYLHGGRGDFTFPTSVGWKGYKIVNDTVSFLKNTGISKGDTLSCPSHEYDGCLINGFDSDSIPIIDTSVLGFYQFNLIGFDRAENDTNGININKGTGCWIAFQKTSTSGKVVNVGSTNWTSGTGIGGVDSIKIIKITENLINMMMEDSVYLTPGYAYSICGNSTICQGDTATLSAKGGVLFLWSNGATSSTILVNPITGTSYTVTITDINGNIHVLTETVNVNANPAQPSVLFNLNTLTSSVTAQHYQWYFNGTEIPGSDSVLIQCNQSGDYTVKVINSNGCYAVSPILYVSCSVGIIDYNNAPKEISISPNPLTQSAVIRFNSKVFKASFELFDMYSQIVKKIPLERTETIFERGGLCNGIYHYRILTKEKIISSGKLILMN